VRYSSPFFFTSKRSTDVGCTRTLNSQALDQDEKVAVLQKVAGQTTREAQKIVFSLADTPIRFKEKIKMIGADTFEVTFTTKEATIQNLENLKGMLAHSHPGISLEQLIHKLTELGLKAFQPIKPVVSPRPNSKAEIKRQIWQRDNDQCSNCGSVNAVEEDHRQPKAKGGLYTLDNMRLLCRSCNQRAAIKHYGTDKMAPHLS
jgi:hypothetical protein